MSFAPGYRFGQGCLRLSADQNVNKFAIWLKRASQLYHCFIGRHHRLERHSIRALRQRVAGQQERNGCTQFFWFLFLHHVQPRFAGQGVQDASVCRIGIRHCERWHGCSCGGNKCLQDCFHDAPKNAGTVGRASPQSCQKSSRGFRHA